ncbi:MAG TPA: site-specific integrase, partial [Rhodomicrobium sp.]|nr:site-specific integrase [Rhodomicrobium sp.]
LRKLYNWAIGRTVYGLLQSPCDRLSPSALVGPAKLRDRVLRDDELRLVWRASDTLGYPFGPLTRLLLITGQRLREVSDLRWGELDLKERLWTIPAERMKGDAAHEVPLCLMAIDLINSLPRFSGDYVFTTTDGERPVSGFSKAKARLDAIVGDLRAKEAAGKESDEKIAPPWRFHDLRRTMRTHLSALPVQDLVRELVIAHRKPGLHRVYDQHAYREEKQEAMKLWDARLRAILDEKSGVADHSEGKVIQRRGGSPGVNVVKMRREPAKASADGQGREKRKTS